ncbi:heat shock protein 70 [Ramicandelaber brevisporus]|nr:heat shock protein 70 [Ramicandelaber brevisporus]
MSVIGFDVGTLQSVIAVARNRGIDVIVNEVSNRATPTLASFGLKHRFLGESAKTQEVSNFKNTVGSFKRIVGRSLQDSEVRDIESRFINAELVDVSDVNGGEVGVRVNSQGGQQVYSATQLTAMYLGKLRDTAAKEIGGPVSDCVISVPAWFTDVQRRRMLEACEVAGLNCLRLVNETTAAALGYGITRTDLPEENPINVAFVDVGHSTATVTIGSLKKGHLQIKSTAYDRHLGGRYFDEVLVDHFAKQFGDKYKIDVKSNNKALFRLRAACERAKKVLSVNSQAPVNVENLMNDVDAAGTILRKDFEDLASGLLDRLAPLLERAISESGVAISDISAIEIVGGSTRIPAIKERLAQFFGKEVSTRLNQDEAVARGCALQCAILSPVFKVREFHLKDVNGHPIKVQWEQASDPVAKSPEDCVLDVFSKNNVVPSTKILTFHRSEPFSFEARYSDVERLPSGTNPWIGNFTVKNVTANKNAPDGFTMVKVKARVNLHGILDIEHAYTVEEVEVEEPIEQPAPANGEAAPASDAPVPTRKVKKLVRKDDLPVISGIPARDAATINSLREKEGAMYANDKLVADTENAKNALEEYIYETRSKLEMQYDEFVTDAGREAFSAQLNDAENWLYEDGYDAAKSEYVSRLQAIRSVAEPIAERAHEAADRPKAERLLREAVRQFRASAGDNSDERFSHIDAADKKKVLAQCDAVEKWIKSTIDKQNELEPTAPLVVRVAEIAAQRDALMKLATPIMTKPKPAPSPDASPAPEAEKKEDKSASNEMDLD